MEIVRRGSEGPKDQAKAFVRFTCLNSDACFVDADLAEMAETFLDLSTRRCKSVSAR
jgi:hypothetical protein